MLFRMRIWRDSFKPCLGELAHVALGYESEGNLMCDEHKSLAGAHGYLDFFGAGLVHGESSGAMGDVGTYLRCFLELPALIVHGGGVSLHFFFV